MKKKGSSILHCIAALFLINGFITLIWWWTILIKEGGWNFSADNLYNDAVAFLLLSIAFGIGTLIHLQIERKGSVK